MDRFRNKYRIPSARAQWWDYGWNGAYFITICTKNRRHYFGEIFNGKMKFTNLGVIADIIWHEIPNHSKFVELGDFVVMPNHIHGILILDKPNYGNNDDPANADDGRNGGPAVQTGHALPSPSPSPSPSLSIGQNRFQNIGKTSISSIIGSYKSAVTKHANRLGLENGWQRLFHDHIIRNDAEYQRISNYIFNNPRNWKDDKFH